MKTAKWMRGLCLLFAVMLVFAACTGPTEESELIGHPDDADTEWGDMPSDDVPASPDGFLGGLDPKAVLATIEGVPVYWEEFYFELQSARQRIEFQEGGPIMDWSATFTTQTVYDETLSFDEFVMLSAMDGVLDRRAVEVLFAELGESLDEDFDEDIREQFMEHNGMDEQVFEEFLRENFLTAAVFSAVNRDFVMRDMALGLLYGSFGEEASDEAVAEVIEEQGILRAKHILISTLDDERMPLPPMEAAAASELARALSQELETLEGEAQLARFEEMLEEYGEDPGMEMEPNGYIFMPGVMIEEFTEATQALEMYEISAPVLGMFGYHIILRLPVQREAVVMQPGGGEWQVQAMAAQLQMQQRMNEISSGLEQTTTPLFWMITPSEIFAWVD